MASRSWIFLIALLCCTSVSLADLRIRRYGPTEIKARQQNEHLGRTLLQEMGEQHWQPEEKKEEQGPGAKWSVNAEDKREDWQPEVKNEEE